eukprot:2327336-Prorocentrum_lima.AAC.1
MTSSLVGSEMCIRDRSRRISGRRGTQGVDNPHVREFANLRSVLAKSTHCLLYTSDAADDM